MYSDTNLKSKYCMLQMPNTHSPVPSSHVHTSHDHQLQHARNVSFVDSNPHFQDLSESFRSLYSKVFENSQGIVRLQISFCTVW